MKNIFKNWQKSLAFLSFFVLGAFLLVGVVWAATTIINNQVSTRKVANNLADFTVLDFTINVDGDTTLAGTEPTGGTAISADKPGDWTQMKFYDASSGGAWNSGTDWIGTSEVDAYVLGGTIVGCPTFELPDPTFAHDRNSCETASKHNTPNGTIGHGGESGLHWLYDSARICTDSYTNPTCVIQASEVDCSGSASTIKGTPGCSASNLVTTSLAKTYGWVYHDISDKSYSHGLESIFIIASPYRTEGAGRNTRFYYESSEYIAGSNPDALTWNGSAWIPTPLSGTKPADWTTLKFYDKVSAGAQFSSSNDWLGLDNDATGFFADRLNAITFNLHSDANTISPANVSNVKLWAGNPGSGTLLGTASSFDGGGSGWYLSGLNRSLSAGSNRFYATMTLNGTASDGKTVRAHIPRYDANNNKTFDLGDSGVFLTTRHL